MALTSYLISYELQQPDERREACLVGALEVFEDRIQALPAAWFVCTAWTADQIRRHLGACLGPDDSLLVEVLQAGRGWSGWVRQDVREWLEKHLGPSC
jgi:hypothetical protein